jgi:hypothetical protein
MPSSILNSDDGAISGTSGLKSTGGDDGVLKIQNNGVDAVTVADDGDVTLAADLSVTGNSSVTGNLLFNSGFGSAGTAYGCRAWVNFDGTGTPAIRESGNVTSITDNGAGNYTVNFTTAMPDADYAMVASTQQGTGTAVYSVQKLDSVAPATSSIQIVSKLQGTGPSDQAYIFVSIFR